MKHESQPSPAAWYKSRTGRTLLALLGVTGVYLLSEHWDHSMLVLPWLVILACPLMHVFMHRGHGGHGGHGAHSGRNNEKERKADG